MPNWTKAIISKKKVKNYILSHTHAVGRFKATLFARLGYTQKGWRRLASDIRKQIVLFEASEVEETKYGKKYIIMGGVEGPNGKTMKVATVWIVRKGETAPIFVTIFPKDDDED